MKQDQSTLCVIWTSSDRGIVFHITPTGNLEYLVTQDGGATWNPATVLIENANIQAVRVDYYGWYRGSNRFDSSIVNHMAVIANSDNYVYAYQMDSESLEILDAKRKQYPAPIKEIAALIRSDGAVSIVVWGERDSSDDLLIEIINPP